MLTFEKVLENIIGKLVFLLLKNYKMQQVNSVVLIL